MARLLPFTIALLLFAGCVQAPEDVETASTSENAGEIFEKYQATSAPAVVASPKAAENATVAPAPPGTWYLATVHASPDTGLSRFDFTIPAGALVPWGYNEVFDEHDEVMALEVALLAEGADVTTWGLLMFEKDDAGAVTPGAGHLEMPATITPYGVLPTGMAAMPDDPSRVVFVNVGDVKEGTVIPVVAMAQAADPAEIGIAFRILDHDPVHPDSKESPAATPEEFVALRNAAHPVGLPSLASGSGFAVNLYQDVLLGGFTPGPGFGLEYVVGEPSVTWNVPTTARSTGGVHTLMASAEGKYQHGYAVAEADYFSWSYGAARYSASTTVHDETVSVSGIDPDAAVTLFTPLALIAGGGAFATGDGDGASHAELSVERAMVPGLVASASVGVIEFGMTLEELVGVAAAKENTVGDNGGLPPLMRLDAHGSTRILPGGGTMSHAFRAQR